MSARIFPRAAADRRAAARRYSVGVIGAGRVGAVLGAALAEAGHHVIAASGVSAASKDRIARLLPAARLMPADEVGGRRGRLVDNPTTSAWSAQRSAYF